jgi:hypothetical protein
MLNTLPVQATRRELKTRNSPRIPGIGAAAKALGVTRDHLRWVIQGKRKGKRLLARYRALKKAMRTEPITIDPTSAEDRINKALASLNKTCDSLSTLLDLVEARTAHTRKELQGVFATFKDVSRDVLKEAREELAAEAASPAPTDAERLVQQRMDKERLF